MAPRIPTSPVRLAWVREGLACDGDGGHAHLAERLELGDGGENLVRRHTAEAEAQRLLAHACPQRGAIARRAAQRRAVRRGLEPLRSIRRPALM